MKNLNLFALFFISSLFIFTLFSCQPKQETSYNISVEIDGLGEDTVYISYLPIRNLGGGYEPKIDTVLAVDNKLVYNFSKQDDYIVHIEPNSLRIKSANGMSISEFGNRILLFIGEQEQVCVTGKIKPHFLEYSVDGNNVTKEYAEYRNEHQEEGKQLDSLTRELTKYPYHIVLNDTLSQRYTIEKQRIAVFRFLHAQELEYVKNHPDSELSIYFLFKHIDNDFSNDYFRSLTEEAKDGILSSLVQVIARYSGSSQIKKEDTYQLEPESKAIDFTLKDINGNDFKLSDIQDKYVVLDFWGSWCGWCILGFPKMKEYYEQYKDRIEIVGVACNDNKRDWKRAVEKNQINWIHVINKENGIPDEDITVSYGIKSFPTKIILDKHLTILHITQGEGKEFYEKLDELLK